MSFRSRWSRRYKCWRGDHFWVYGGVGNDHKWVDLGRYCLFCQTNFPVEKLGD